MSRISWRWFALTDAAADVEGDDEQDVFVNVRRRSALFPTPSKRDAGLSRVLRTGA